MSNGAHCATALEFLRPTVEKMANAFEQATMPSDGTQMVMKEVSCKSFEKGSPAAIIQDCIQACYRAFGVHETATAIEELRYLGYDDVLPKTPPLR